MLSVLDTLNPLTKILLSGPYQLSLLGRTGFLLSLIRSPLTAVLQLLRFCDFAMLDWFLRARNATFYLD